MFYKTRQTVRKSFSLIELLIVIAIMGALAALILPAFSDSETQAKDTACDYNNAGTLRYVTMFKAANGVYPSGFHTGMNAATGDVTVQTKDENDADKDAMATVTAGNMTGATEALDAAYIASLQNAGIAQLAYGKEAAEDIANAAVTPRAISGDWSDSMNADGTHKTITDGGEALTLKGVPLSTWVSAGNKELGADDGAGGTVALDGDEKRCRKADEPSFKIVPLFAASTIDWEKAYPYNSASQDSKVSVAMEGKCPWLDAGTFRYYICFFKAYSDGTAAKLIGTACPECGILDADDF